MKNSVVIILEGEPLAWQRTGLVSTGGKPRPFVRQQTRTYQKAVQWSARIAMGGRPLFVGPVAVSIVAALPIPPSWTNRERTLARRGEIVPTVKPDVDNFAKIVCDSLNAVVYHDDKQVSFLQVG